MSKDQREWNPRFIKYMEMIINHPNYKGLRIDKKNDGSYNWIAPAKSDVGKERIEWCEAKAIELGYPIQPGVYADVMLTIHPTKAKVCQICGKEMSLYYHYPNVNFLKSLNKQFDSDFTYCDHISDIWDTLISNGVSESKIAAFLITKGGLDLSPSSGKDTIIKALEFACRKGNKKCLGPGAMSNFPDRFDGFHTYNRCCRASQDKGRSSKNLRSYTKDRRAYEYWSDGNIHAANQFMGSDFFSGTSADHIGPISLGFVHDPRYLQPMTGSDNSTKRDRLQIIDIEKIIETETRTHVYPMSWYSRLIWEYIKEHFESNPEKVSTEYRNALKQNMANYMYILWKILESCPEGELFLTKNFLEPNYKYFDYTYSFNEKGEIVSQQPRHRTGRNQHETERYSRIAIDSVYEYYEKENRNISNDLSDSEQHKLLTICDSINRNYKEKDNKTLIVNFVKALQTRIISDL